MRANRSPYKLYILFGIAIMLAVLVRGGTEPSFDSSLKPGPDGKGYGGPEAAYEAEDYYDSSSFFAVPEWTLVVGQPPVEMEEAVARQKLASERQEVEIREEVASVSLPAHQELPEVADPEEDQEEVAGEEPEQGLRIYEHRVASGESLWEIANSYGIQVDTLIAANELPDADRLQVGQTLKVPSKDGALHVVRKGESLWEISRDYHVDMETIIKENNLDNPRSLKVGQELFVPGGQTVAANRYRLVTRSGRLRRVFEWPVHGWISSRFGMRWGRMHEGLDIAVPTGTPVRASAAGRVKFAGVNGGYGKLVIIDHGQGVETRYGHNSRLLVRAGQSVSKGQVIARSGSTGRSTGPHVHFEIRLHGRPYDPLKYLVPR